MGSENDSGGAICREELAEIIKNNSLAKVSYKKEQFIKRANSPASNCEDDLGVDEHTIEPPLPYH